MSDALTIGIIATSSAVPRVELAAGAARLAREGFAVFVHPHCERQYFTFAGTDQERASSLFEYATGRADVLWCACGGYGAARVLPLLDRLTAERGTPPKKLLVGYSDVTALHHYVRTRWGWATLHAPMPAAPDFGSYDEATWQAIVHFVRGRRPASPWGERPLRFLGPPPAKALRGRLVGGNLMVWNSLTGTPYMPRPSGEEILFFEEIGEKAYAIDRMVTQLGQAGGFDGARAIVLGDFTNCRDDVSQVAADGGEKMPLRRQMALDEALAEIFGGVGRKWGIPVAAGLPVGHGPHFRPLPLGANYQIRPDGGFELLAWNGLENGTE